MAPSTYGSKINCGLLNFHSDGNKTFNICYLIKESDLSILMLTETWLNEYDNVQIRKVTPITHTFLHIPREIKKGGRVGILPSNSFKKIRRWNTFESMQVNFEIIRRKLSFLWFINLQIQELMRFLTTIRYI